MRKENSMYSDIGVNNIRVARGPLSEKLLTHRRELMTWEPSIL
jgi:hypothetical protein